MNPQQLRLYAVTDRSWLKPGETLAEVVETLLKAGVTCVQLREKGAEDAFILQEAQELKALCHRYGVPFLVNDRPDLAQAVGADGVHVGSEDLPVAHIRRRAGPDFIIGATAKTVQQAQAAQAAGANYLGVGAVFPSPTKPGAQRLTPEELGGICASVSIPAVAIGGIGPSNLAQLKGSGAAGIAVVSSLFGAEDIQAAAQALARQARQVLFPHPIP